MKMWETNDFLGARRKKEAALFGAASCAEKYLSVPSANAQPSAQDFYSSEREPQKGNRRASIRGRCRVDRCGEVEAPAGTVQRPSCECALPINMGNPGSRLGD